MPALARRSALENQLIEDVAAFYADPLGYVRYAFPWGEPGPLEKETGPDTWQADVLTDLRQEILRRQNADDQELELLGAIRIAVASGHGIGKTALIAWILLWFLGTRPHCQIVCTANTKTQLSTKTWRELAKWQRLAINGSWFKWTATRFYAIEAPDTWFGAAIPWSKERPEAFAGTHERHLLYLFDEASAIDEIIWETSDGAMTTRGAMWIAFGNPTRNTGRFSECFGKFRHRWITRRIDSRQAKMANQAQIRQYIEDYGEDSDFVRVRIKGQSPRAGDMQLIRGDLVDAAMVRSLEPRVFTQYPKYIGVDVARYGDDQSVIIRRQGPKVWTPKTYRGIDIMALVGYVMDEQREFGARAVFVDGTGLGAGAVDRLKQLGVPVVDVQFGSQATDKNRYYNRRTQIWADMADWVKGDVDLPDDCSALRDDLIGPEYGFDGRLRMQLERKEDMKKRGLASPDIGDALACTFDEYRATAMPRARTIKRVRWA